MSVQYLVPVKDSIAMKLIKLVFGIYIIVTFSVTMIHMVAEYFDTQNRVMEDLKIVGQTIEHGLAIAFWNEDDDQLRSIIMGTVHLPAIVGICLNDVQGQEAGAIGMIIDKNRNIISIDSEDNRLLIEEISSLPKLFWYKVPIVYTEEGETFKVGEVTLYSSIAVVFNKLKLGYLLLVINSIIKTTALWIIFLWVSRIYLSRPLATLTTATEQIDLDNLKNFKVNVQTSEGNELKVLEVAFNAMINKLLNAHQKLQEYTDELKVKKEIISNLLKNKTLIAKTIAQGNLSVEVELASENDELGKALQTMVTSLQSKLFALESIALGICRLKSN